MQFWHKILRITLTAGEAWRTTKVRHLSNRELDCSTSGRRRSGGIIVLPGGSYVSDVIP